MKKAFIVLAALVVAVRCFAVSFSLTNDSTVAVNAFFFCTNGTIVFTPNSTNTLIIATNIQVGAITNIGDYRTPGCGSFVASGIAIAPTNNPFKLASIKWFDATMITNVGGRVLYITTNADALVYFDPSKYSTKTNFTLTPTNKAGF